MKNISITDLPKYMDNQTLLVDVRVPLEYQKKHLKGAINMPYHNTLSMLKSYPKDTKIILYCDKGYYSKRIANLLTGLGYTFVYNLGGVDI